MPAIYSKLFEVLWNWVPMFFFLSSGYETGFSYCVFDSLCTLCFGLSIRYMYSRLT